MLTSAPNDRSKNRNQTSKLWRNCKNVRVLNQIHASLIIKGFNSNPSALRELVFCAAVALSGTISYAHKMFVQIAEPDLFMWNTIIRGSSRSGNITRAISLYTQMENSGVKPDKFAFLYLLKACTKLQWRNTGFCAHAKVLRLGFDGNEFVRNSLIHFHANCGDLGIGREIFNGSEEKDVVAWSALTVGYARRGELGAARRLFNEMPERDLVSSNVMITEYVKVGDMVSAKGLFDEVPERDVVTWNAMISGYVHCGDSEQALTMFEEMRRVGECPDEVTLLSLVSACASLGDLEVGRKLHCTILDMRRGNVNNWLGNALIDMYAKCGSIEKAMEVFRGMKKKDVCTWNSVICGLALHGRCEESVSLFTELQRLKSIKPNEVTFTGVLVACSHSGKVEEGRYCFDLMINKYNIEPSIRHYGCMVDLLGRAGLLKEAFEFIDNMNIEPNGIIWRTLLAGCRIHGNVELAKYANDRLLKLRWDESGDYVLLSNIYAEIGEWDGVEKVRKSMDNSGVRKEVGHSLTEADDGALVQFLFDSEPEVNSRIKARIRFFFFSEKQTFAECP